jgi:hypothetical protein
MSLKMPLIALMLLAIGGIAFLITASLIASSIVKVVQGGGVSGSPIPQKVNNFFVDFTKVAEAYIEKTSDKARVYLVYILSAGGAALFVFSVLGMLRALNLPR